MWNSRQSLAESSRELTEKENSQKRKFDQVEVITGEESESNVLQVGISIRLCMNETVAFSNIIYVNPSAEKRIFVGVLHH